MFNLKQTSFDMLSSSMNIPTKAFQSLLPSTDCTNITYDPYAFSIGMNVLQDDRSLYEYSVSGRNPSPLCVPVPYMPLNVDLCVRLFNVFTPGRNLHVCMDWMTRVLHQPVFVSAFFLNSESARLCIRMSQKRFRRARAENVDR